MSSHLEAHLPPQFQILGLYLKPFCLGHYMILSSDVPSILDIQQEIKTSDFLYAIYICANSFEDGLRFRVEGDSSVRVWSDKVLRRGMIVPSRRIDLVNRFTLFRDYLEAGLSVPKFWANDGPSISLGSHWSEHLIVTLMAHLGCSESQSMNMYLPLARRRYMTYWEIQNGKKILYSDQDSEDQEFARSLERKRNGC